MVVGATVVVVVVVVVVGTAVVVVVVVGATVVVVVVVVVVGTTVVVVGATVVVVVGATVVVVGSYRYKSEVALYFSLLVPVIANDSLYCCPANITLDKSISLTFSLTIAEETSVFTL